MTDMTKPEPQRLPAVRPRADLTVVEALRQVQGLQISDLLTRPGGQLYVVLGQAVTSADGTADRYQLRLWWKPLVWWIWLGGALIAVGATLSLLGRAQLLEIWRARRARKAQERFA